MDEFLKVLIVEDTEEDVELMKRELTKAKIKFRAVVVQDQAGLEAALSRFVPDVILCDHVLPHFNSIDALKLTRSFASEQGTPIPFILVTGSLSEESAVQIVRSGADDFILKDRMKRLPSAIESAREKCRIENERAKALAERNDVFEILRQSLHEIYIFNPETLLFEYVNDGALNNLGYTRREIRDLTAIDIQGEFTEKRFRQMLAEVETADAQKKIFKTRHLRKNKTQYAVEVHLQSITQGKRKTFLAIAADITELNKQLAHLDLHKEKLKEIARMQSHEVRAPLSRIMGLVMLIRDNKGDLNEVLPHLLKTADELDAVIKKIVAKTEAIDLLGPE